MRALLLRPVAIVAAVGLGLLGAALLLFSGVFHPQVASASSDCGQVPQSSVILTTSTATIGGAAAGSSSTTSTSTTTATPTSTTDTTTTPASGDTATTTATTTSTTDTTQTSTTTTTTPASQTTSPSPTPELCVLVQSYPSDGDVLAGDSASYTVWVWSLTADATGVSVFASANSSVAGAASELGSATFDICPSASGSTCTIGVLPVGDVYELLASVPVTADAAAGTDIELTATATGTGASPDSSTATDDVVSTTAATTSSTSSTSSAGSVPALVSLPPIPGTAVSAIDPTDLFPTVSPTPASNGSLGLPPAKAHHVVHATEAAYAVPIDPRLLGAQIVGLVALAGAVTIAIVRLSLRKPQLAKPRPADPSDTTVAS